MILKRILPVVAAVAVLCCMMIVPASAASVSEFNSNGYRSFADLDVYLMFDNADGYGYSLSVSHPERILDDMCSWETLGGSFFSIAYYEQYTYDSLITESQISLDSQYGIYALDFEFDDFVIPYNRSIFATLFSVLCYTGDSGRFSFDVSFVNSSGDVERAFCEFSFDAVYEYINPFVECGVYDYLAGLGVTSSSYVMFSNYCLHLNRQNMALNHVAYRVYCPSEDYDAVDFLHYNGIDYGDFISEELSGLGIMQGFSTFLTDGVGAFLATPMFGEFSLGQVLSAVVAIILALVIIKMFGH